MNPANGESMDLNTEKRAFHILTCIEGAVSVEHDGTVISLDKGQTALIPASLGRYAIQGTGSILRSWQP